MGTEDMQNQPIGVFDSGLGGLTVVREIWRKMPGEEIVYFGDTARVPYGGRTVEDIRAINSQIIEFLLSQDVKAIVFACNTSSALALAEMRLRFSVPMFGIIRPGAKAALAATDNRRIGLIATQATVNSGAYREAILSLDPEVFLVEQACPKLVPLIEAGEIDSPAAAQALQEYLAPLEQQGVDSIIYGCTHYPFLESGIEQLFPNRFKLVNPARSCVLETKDFLQQQGLLSMRKEREDQFYVSSDPGKFAALGSRLIGSILPPPRMVNVDCGPIRVSP